MSEPLSPEDRRHINRWRGLRGHVLDQLDALDLAAEARGCRFAAERAEARASRARCRELRARLGVDDMWKAR